MISTLKHQNGLNVDQNELERSFGQTGHELDQKDYYQQDEDHGG